MNNEQMKLFGLAETDKEAYEKSKNIKPSVPTTALEGNESLIVKVISNVPEELTFMNNDDKEETHPILLVEYEGEKHNLWLSAMSLKMGCLKIAEKHNMELENITLKISVREYSHKKHGKSRAYIVSEVTSDE